MFGLETGHTTRPDAVDVDGVTVEGGVAAQVTVADLVRNIAMLARLAGADPDRLGPGELNGFGPIPARVINQLARAADTGFSYCMSITDAGRVIFHNRLG